MQKIIVLILFTALCWSGFSSCKDREGAPEGNAVYYWRTGFSLSDKEREFLKDNDIQVLYLHLFDVVRNPQKDLVPEATLSFNDSSAVRDIVRQGIKVVPVVFIDSKALDGDFNPDSLSGLIINRAERMLTLNGLPAPDELQLDYDWRESTRGKFFALVETASKKMHVKDGRLSVTVRLHQLSQPAPKADYGVLMVYNTGDFKNPDEQNSILSLKSLQPYLSHLGSYKLPLATALPVYSWNLAFNGDRFDMIARGININDTTLFRPIDAGHYRCMEYMAVQSGANPSNMTGRMYPGTIIRHELVHPDTIVEVLRRIQGYNPGALRRKVIYHLDENSLQQYDENFFKTLYSVGSSDTRNK